MSEQDTTEEATTSDDGDADGDEHADTEDTQTAVDVGIEDAPEDLDIDEIDLDAVAGEADEELLGRVQESDPDEVARELAALRSRNETLAAEVEELQSDVEELEDKLRRKQSEFQNYKKRMDERREEEKQRATEDLVTRILDVRDNLDRALEQDEDTDIRGGVESTLRQLDDELDAENVAVIDPDPGEDVDPTVHQVLANVESEQAPGTIADVHRPGYEMAGKVLREAQVTVSSEASEEE